MDVKSIQNVESARQINSQNVQFLNQREQVKVQKETVKNQQEELKNQKVSPEILEKIIEELRKKLSMLNTQLKIQIDKDTDMTVIKVIDKQTNKVIRQIPPEYVLKIAKYLDEIAGLLLNEKA